MIFNGFDKKGKNVTLMDKKKEYFVFSTYYFILLYRYKYYILT